MTTLHHQRLVNEALATLPFFSGLADREVKAIRPLCRVLEGESGDYLILEGARVPCVFFLLTGKVDVYKKKSKDGEKVWLASLGKGFVFGELSFLDETPASATVRAGTAFQALAIDQEALHQLLDHRPRLGYKMIKALARVTSLRLRRADAMLAGVPGTSYKLTVT